jgi:hypothetical protein
MERIRRYPSELPKDMQRALRAFEMNTADHEGRLVIREVIFVGHVEPHEPAEQTAKEH